MKGSYDEYKKRTEVIIKDTMEAMECRPIYFIGTGVSKRYFDAPNWRELLQCIALKIGLDASMFNYIVQKHSSNNVSIGSELEGLVFEWAWKGGKNSFPSEYFEKEYEKSIFIKHLAAIVLKEKFKLPDTVDGYNHKEEVSRMSSSHPHAIVTTNYDEMLESIFSDYEVVIGQKIIRRDMNVVGEIFKIHGSLSDPDSIVLTGADYEEYRNKKKYISAKLLTYIAEHPVFIFGYSLNDPNVSGIIEDIGEIVCQGDGVIENIFYVEWRSDAEKLKEYREEYVIGSAESQLRVRAIVTDSYDWVFDAISENSPLKWVDPKILRTISSRFYKLIRKDIPKSTIDINYQHLAGIAESSDMIPKFLGFGFAESPSASHPFTLTEVGKKLGYKTWHKANDLIGLIQTQKGIDIKATDNKYHYAIPSGNGRFRRYSEEALELLKKVRDKNEYVVEIE